MVIRLDRLYSLLMVVIRVDCRLSLLGVLMLLRVGMALQPKRLRNDLHYKENVP
jgi:hypothetical protein